MANEQDAVSPADERQQRMQRIRVGLTGLAVVLVLVFVATAIVSRVTSNAVPSLSNQAATVEANGAETDEPLADLGVAPGASEPHNQSTGAKKP